MSLSEASKAYWTSHNVTNHRKFTSREASLDHLDWRNNHCLFYDQLMPNAGWDGCVILDYGCGPGNDLVGFSEHSKPKKIIAADVSPASLQEARDRYEWHKETGVPVDFLQMPPNVANIPVAGESVDYVHCSGVLHHMEDPSPVMKEFFRVLKPGGVVRAMVYNYESIWVHLYVPFVRQILRSIDANLPLAEAFRRSTDGEACPISRWYTQEEFLHLAKASGFAKREFSGSSISLIELNLMTHRFSALEHPDLRKIHRDYLKQLTLDAYGRPLYRGEVFGINGHYELKK